MKTFAHLKNFVIHIQMFLLILLVGLAGCNNKKFAGPNEGTTEFVADSVYIKQGNQLVAHTFDTLRNSLLRAIQSQGMDGAIAFCNEKAYPLTHNYADSVIIRRTSLRTRNPDNNPDSLETIVLNEMEKVVKTSQTPGAKVLRKRSNGEVHFFKPIMLQAMCLNCHGIPQAQIQGATLAKIQQFYPNDRAVNFKEGDLRGVWHIIFNPKQ